MSETREPIIISTPGVCGGRPRLQGTRLTVQDILGALAAGDTVDELLIDFPYLTREDFSAVLQRPPASHARRDSSHQMNARIVENSLSF